MRLHRDSDGQSVEVDDNDRRLIDYYLGEGYTGEENTTEVVSFPRVFDGDRYVDGAPQQVEQLPDGESVELADEVEVPATGQPSEGVEAPADGTPVELSNP